jgi:ribosomal-protein-alanine N-acetyltransferase
MKYAGGIRTRGQVENYIEKMLKSWQKNQLGVWAITWKNEETILGEGGLCFLEKTPEIEVGYVLDKPYWNLGLATEVAKASLRYGFEVVNLERIVAVANPKNFASRRVMEKVGMKYEKDAFYYQSDVVYYSISKSDYSSDGSLFVLRT